MAAKSSIRARSAMVFPGARKSTARIHSAQRARKNFAAGCMTWRGCHVSFEFWVLSFEFSRDRQKEPDAEPKPRTQNQKSEPIPDPRAVVCHVLRDIHRPARARGSCVVCHVIRDK